MSLHVARPDLSSHVNRSRPSGSARPGVEGVWADPLPERPWSTTSRWIMLMLVLSVVTWRAQTIYDGGLDFVVLAKAALGSLAVGLAWAARVCAPVGRPMGNTFVWLLLAFITMSTFGAWTDGGLAVSGVLSMRLLLVTIAVVLLVKTFPRPQLLYDLLTSFTVVALVTAVTGVPSLVTDGRLRGGILQLHPNELSLVCALPAVGLVYLVIQRRASLRHYLLLATLAAALVATGSRTALLTVLLAALIMLVQARRLNPGLTVTLVASLPALLFIGSQTGIIEGFITREGDGEGDITTLNSRSIVWAAAWDYPTTEWLRWLGSGLAVKRIPVEGQYWDTQNLDSSWVSALVQGGYLGATLLAVWILVLTVKTLRMPRGPRIMTQALLVAMFVRSILESGLVDSSPAFLTLILISLLADTPGTGPRCGGPEVSSRRDGTRRPSAR